MDCEQKTFLAQNLTNGETAATINNSMCKVIAMMCLVGLMAACSSNETIHLSPEAFQQVCKDIETSEAVSAGADATNTQQNVISIGMQVSVTVGEDSSLNRTYPVVPNCTLDIAAVGRIKVCGLTTDELTAKIKSVLERDYFTHATVTVAIESPQSGGSGSNPSTASSPTGVGIIYVLGEVGRPGPMQLPASDEFTLTKTIIAAGGFTTFARGDHVRVIRYCGTGRKYETFVNVARIMKRGEFEDDLPLRPNDWVIVPQKVISFF